MGPEEIAKYNPQRFEFLQLTSVLHYDDEANLIVASRVVGEDEWWCHGHIPGRPLFPGVMQAEVLAQASSIHVRLHCHVPREVFLGFHGIEDMRFRLSIAPGEKLWVAGKLTRTNIGRLAFRWEGQVIKEDGRIASNGVILGMKI
ncbi:MAG: beta-hydroxyacyl-ACP dehydratase [Planctomycetes bacterium]|nr:beta-hydroxyacyl-ACP dehydratase [Planctomycetota bacterium]MBL7007379.1 beta-hydroxyacyl-ACP dehydratase [Planctomycetota bacterium]